MKTRSPSSIFACLVLLAFTFATSAASGQTLLTYFNFNDSNTQNDLPGAQLAATIVSSPVDGVNPANMHFTSGTLENRATGVVLPGGFALTINAGTFPDITNNGKSVQFSITTLGFPDLVLSYATARSTDGFTLQTLAYSTDGSTFTDFGTVAPASSFDTYLLALPVAASNVNTLTIRLTLSGATDSAGTNSLDNIQVTAEPIPEPAGVAGGALAFLGLCYAQRKRLLALVAPVA